MTFFLSVISIVCLIGYVVCGYYLLALPAMIIRKLLRSPTPTAFPAVVRCIMAVAGVVCLVGVQLAEDHLIPGKIFQFTQTGILSAVIALFALMTGSLWIIHAFLLLAIKVINKFRTQKQTPI